MHIDIDIIVYAVIAVILLGRLWFVLGTRNEDETQRPNPFTPPPPRMTANDSQFANTPTVSSRMQATIPPPNSLAGGLTQIAAIDPTFNEKQFLQNVRDVFPIVVSAYAAGNMNSIADFLSPALLAHFQKSADLRASEGQTAQSKVTALRDAEVIEARAENAQALIAVKIISDQENILRDKSGAIIGGAVGTPEQLTDIWVFGKDTQNPEAKWVVVETRG